MFYIQTLTAVRLFVHSGTGAGTKCQLDVRIEERLTEYHWSWYQYSKWHPYGRHKFCSMHQQSSSFGNSITHTQQPNNLMCYKSRKRCVECYPKRGEGQTSGNDAAFQPVTWYWRNHSNSSRQYNDSIGRTNGSIVCIPDQQHHSADFGMPISIDYYGYR